MASSVPDHRADGEPAKRPESLYLFLPSVSSAFPNRGLGRLPASDPLETTSCGPMISERQIFLYVQTSKTPCADGDLKGVFRVPNPATRSVGRFYGPLRQSR